MTEKEHRCEGMPESKFGSWRITFWSIDEGQEWDLEYDEPGVSTYTKIKYCPWCGVELDNHE